jgi:hypothetical protein
VYDMTTRRTDRRRTLKGMTRSASRIAVVVAAVAFGAATLGCGFISNVSNAVDNVKDVAALTDKMTKSAQLTFTADYKLADGTGNATVVQQPPNAAFVGKDGTFILTQESLLMCTTKTGKTTCQRSPNTNAGQSTVDQGAYLQAVAGGGFISTPMAIALLGAAAIVPSVKMDKSTRTVAGLKSTCVNATGISQQAGANNVEMKEVSVCVADNGVLTEFVGTGTDGSKVGVTLAKYGTTVNAAAFAPPKGAKIVDVNSLPTS